MWEKWAEAPHHIASPPPCGRTLRWVSLTKDPRLRFFTHSPRHSRAVCAQKCGRKYLVRLCKTPTLLWQGLMALHHHLRHEEARPSLTRPRRRPARALLASGDAALAIAPSRQAGTPVAKPRGARRRATPSRGRPEPAPTGPGPQASEPLLRRPRRALPASRDAAIAVALSQREGRPVARHGGARRRAAPSRGRPKPPPTGPGRRASEPRLRRPGRALPTSRDAATAVSPSRREGTPVGTPGGAPVRVAPSCGRH